MKLNKKLHHAWIIMLGAILFQGGSGLMENCNSLFLAQAQKEIGMSAGQVSAYLMIFTISTALAIPIASRIFFRANIKVSLSILAICMGLGFSIMAVGQTHWHWYLFGFARGIGFCLFTIAMPVIVNNWFKDKIGLALSITMSASGLGGGLYSLLASKMISAMGWREAMVVTGIIGTSIMLISSLFILRMRPADLGLLPYTNDGSDRSTNKTNKQSAPPAHNKSNLVFILCATVICIGNSLTRYAYYLPLYSTVIGGTIALTGALNLFVMMGNVSGKLVIGTAADRLGVWKASRIQFSIVAVSFVALIMGVGSTALRFGGGLLFGASFSLAAMLPAMLTRAIYDGEAYQLMLSKFTIWMNLCAALATLIIGFFVDNLGGYPSAFLFGIAICAISIFTLIGLERVISKKSKNDVAL